MAKRKKIGTEKFSEDLVPLVRPIEGLTLDPSNARLHSERNIAAIRYSLRRFGQKKPIVVRDGVVLAGNGTLRAAVEEGWANIAVTEFEGTDDEAAAFAIADNRTAELGEWDEDVLAGVLEGLDEGLREIAGFSAGELDGLGGDGPAGPGMGGAEAPEVEFSEVIGESNNYVVLTFRNDVDWLAAQTHFNLSTKAATRRGGGEWSRGVGRVVDGAAYLSSLSEFGGS